MNIWQEERLKSLLQTVLLVVTTSVVALFIFVGPVLAQDTPTPTTLPTTLPTPSPTGAAAATDTPPATTLFFLTPWISPTPGADGTITIIVQPGEALWTIAARADLTLQELLALNNLPDNAIIQPGDTLLIGYGTPEAPPTDTIASGSTTPGTPPPEEGRPTLPPPTPRPTQATRRTSAVCLSAFEDLDRNGQQDPDEPLKAGVAFTLFNTTAVVGNYVTDGVSEPYCMEELAPGEYQITRSLTRGEVLTTDGNWRLVLAPGSRLTQSFGSYSDTTAAGAAVTSAAPPTTTTPAAAVADAGSVATEVNSQSTAVLTAAPDLPGNIGRSLVALGIALLILAAVLILLVKRVRSRT